jgi:glycosyltransferase involved in cell wall biosynthesis
VPAPDSPASVSVVIPTQGRRPEVLKQAITRLTAETSVREVLLVDDSGQLALRLGKPHYGLVSVIPVRGLGPNTSRQAGLEAATGDVVLFLADDVLPDPDLASRHLACHDAHSNAVVLGYMPVAQDGNGAHASATSHLYAVEYEARVAGYQADPDSILSNLWGGNVSLLRVDALRIGVENPSYPGRRHEDQDFGIRCAQAGLVGVFDRTLHASHIYRRSRLEFLRDARAQGYERTTLAQTHPGATWHGTGSHASLSTGSKVLGRTTNRRQADLLILKTARRIELWRGSISANRSIRQSGDDT